MAGKLCGAVLFLLLFGGMCVGFVIRSLQLWFDFFYGSKCCGVCLSFF